MHPLARTKKYCLFLFLIAGDRILSRVNDSYSSVAQMTQPQAIQRDAIGTAAQVTKNGAVQALSQHWPEYLMEGAELGMFMVSACVFTVLFEYPGSPVYQAIPDPFLRRALIGLAMAATAITIVYSSWGKQSGAHFNPAVTLAFLRLKKIAPWDAAFYIVAQFAGSVAGVTLASLLIGMALAHRNVNFAVTAPGPTGPGIAFAAEVLISFVLLTTILNVSNRKNLSRYTGLFAGALVATYITFEAPLSGMSMNPARTFGSAFNARAFDNLRIYFVAPPIGMLLAAEIYTRTRSAKEIYCAKLNHHNSKRCIFRCRFAELQNFTAASEK